MRPELKWYASGEDIVNGYGDVICTPGARAAKVFAFIHNIPFIGHYLIRERYYG